MIFGKAIKSENLKIIILVGNRDFGRYPLASRLHTALWPVAGKPVLERLLDHLAEQGICQVTVCAGGDSEIVKESINIDSHLNVRFMDEILPVGTAGCIRESVSKEKDDLIFVFPANIICPPTLDSLISAHKKGRADLTMMLNPCYEKDNEVGIASGIYICNPGVLEYIPQAGYSDIKEGLIPEMLRAGKDVYAAKLPEHAGNFRDRQEYIYNVAPYLSKNSKLREEFKHYKRTDSQAVLISPKAKISPRAKLSGSVVVMDNVVIDDGVIIIGPSIIGKDVHIGHDSIVINSILWEGSRIGSNCRLCKSVVDYKAKVTNNTFTQEQSVLLEPQSLFIQAGDQAKKIACKFSNGMERLLQPHLDKINAVLPDWACIDRKKITAFLGPGMIFIAFLWSYWPGLVDLWDLWSTSDEYSSGLLVPFLAVYVLWSRRDEIARCEIRPSVLGIFAFLFAQFVRFFGLYFMFSSLERLSIALTIASLVVLLYGLRFFRKMATILLFLCLMLPLPNQVQTTVAQPLQSWATASAVFCLEMVGYDVIREGNIIHIGQSTVAVAEACNGLRMVTAFFVTSGLVVLLVKRAWWEKLFVLISSLPIALLCNTVRLAVTAVFFTILEGEQWEKAFHDFGGYAMMPLALAAIVGELWLLKKLTMLPEEEKAIIITRQS